MNEFRIRPKSDYLHIADWQQLYVLAEHWESDMKFKEIELNFLKDLIGKYFIWMTREENITVVQDTLEKLKKIAARQNEIASSIKSHLRNIEELIELPTSHDQVVFREEHIELEDRIASFSKDLRAIKQDIFKLTEEVLESEKIRHLLHE